MHELLLYGQVSEARHELVLKVLAGVAAMQPRRVITRRVVYKPRRPPVEPGSNLKRGGSQAVGIRTPKQAAPKDLYHVQLVQDLTKDDFNQAPGDAEPSEGRTLTASSRKPWTLVFNDVPDSGDRGGVLVRSSNTTDILSGDPHQYMLDLEYQYVSEYYVEGYRFVHNNIVVFLNRILIESGNISGHLSPKTVIPSFEDLQLFDPSGSYIIEAKIRVEDLNNSAVNQTAVAELHKFKAQMKGCVELSMPERLDFDYRVKWKPAQSVVVARPR